MHEYRQENVESAVRGRMARRKINLIKPITQSKYLTLVKNPYTKKSLKFKLSRKLYIELFWSSHSIWLKWKLRKFLKLQTTGKNLREQSSIQLTNNSVKQMTKVGEKCARQFSMSNLRNHVRRVWIQKEWKEGRGRGQCKLNFKNERYFLQLFGQHIGLTFIY